MPSGSTGTEQVPSVDAVYHPTHDESARQGFVAALRAFTGRDMRDKLADQYHARVLPVVERSGSEPPKTGREIEKLMAPMPYYRFYSAMRYNAQEMMYQSVLDPVERVAGPAPGATALRDGPRRPPGAGFVSPRICGG
jgi:hypothetical protein